MESPKKPLITTVIPTYRRPNLLRKAIQSVLDQSFPFFQIYVCDNASGDETASLVSEFSQRDSRVKYYSQSENIGAIPNFNFGMKQVKTPFFSLLADDNLLLPQFFEDAINTLTEHPEATLFAGQTITVNERRQKLGSSLLGWERGLIFPPQGLLNIWEKGLPTWESVMFKSEVLKSIGFLDPCFNPSTDQDFMMKIARKYTIYISKEPYALFLRQERSWGFNRNLNEAVSTWTKLAERYLHDDGLSEPTRGRIHRAYKRTVNKSISDELFIHGIVKGDPLVVADAVNIVKNNSGFSFKSLKAIIVAKVAQQHRIFRSLILGYARWSIQAKRNIYNLLNKL